MMKKKKCFIALVANHTLRSFNVSKASREYKNYCKSFNVENPKYAVSKKQMSTHGYRAGLNGSKRFCRKIYKEFKKTVL